MKLRDEISELRKRLPLLRQLAMPDVDNFQLEHLLDFHDKAVAALRHYEAMYMVYMDMATGDGPFRKDVGLEAREVLALLDKEVE